MDNAYNYYLLRITVNSGSGSASGQWVTGTNKKTVRDNAIKAFYTLASTAANSNNNIDTVVLLNDTGVPIKIQRFRHEVST